MILSKPGDIGERLYLQKDRANTIALDLPIPLPQHQIDGIRFLYRLFKKKAPGAILNDPSGYGKCLQVVLFISALRPILKKPVLILSNDLDNWKQHFEIWTNCFDDLAVGISYPYSRKQIYVNSIPDGAACSRRSWGIVVLHDEQRAHTNELLKLRLTSDYNIWVTSRDLKEDLYTLSMVYEFLHPNQKFNVSLFTATKNDFQDVMEKALLLDAFLEDFLIRRTDFLLPFDKPMKPEPLPEPAPVKATRKNKDPTGTKVKRSRKRTIDDNFIDNVNEEGHNEAKSANNNEPEISVSKNNDMDVESFIRNEKPIESEGFNFYNSNETSQDSTSFTIKPNVDTKSREGKEIIDHSKDESSSSKVNVDSAFRFQQNEESSQNILDTEDKSDEENKNGVIVPATEDSPEIRSFYSVDDKSIHKETNNKEDNATKSGIIVPETENSENSQNDNIENFEDECSRPESINVTIPETENSRSPQNDNLAIYEDLSSQSESKDWVIDENYVAKNDDSVSNDNGLDSKSIIGNGDKSGANNDNTNSKSNELPKKKTIIDELDADLAEVEAKALKKFKGSILDSFF